MLSFRASLLIQITFAFSLAASCSDANFSGQLTRTDASKSADASGKPADPGSSETPGTTPGDPSLVPTARAKAKVSFKFGGTTANEVPSDFLLVVDNSSSMNPHVQRVVESFAKIPPARFGSKAKIGVVTGMVSKTTDFSVLNEGINPYTGIELEPGYQALSNAAAIAAFKAGPAPDNYKNKYPLKGCANGWITPGEKNSAGEDCLKAHLQLAAHGVGCEPNTYAVKQLMDRAAGKKFFREGAFIHVIFVSDELNPGCNRAELLNNCPSADDLKTAITANTNNQGMRFHGVVRPEPAATAATSKCAYQKVINPTGGKWVDLTDTTIPDYSTLIEAIIDSSHPTELVYKMPYKSAVVEAIRIDGAPYTGAHKIDEEGNLRISGLDLAASHDFEVEYNHY
jgi:hypothetical protein